MHVELLGRADLLVWGWLKPLGVLLASLWASEFPEAIGQIAEEAPSLVGLAQE